MVIQDTTEFNYHGIKEKLLKNEDQDIGPTGRDNIAGYFCHPGLVINPKNDTIYGFSSALIYNRKWDKKNRHERDYKNLPIEEKESYRWIETAEISKRIIGEETRMTIIGERESDIYEEFLQVPDVRTDVLAWAKANRRLVGEDEKLFEYISEQSVRMSFPLDVSGKTKKQKNPYPANSLAWCAWTIARLPGWSGYISQGPPGYITIKEGYDRFKLQLEGYLIKKKDVHKD